MSVPAERIFSTARLIVNQQRSCLKPENVDMLIFLNKNLPKNLWLFCNNLCVSSVFAFHFCIAFHSLVKLAALDLMVCDLPLTHFMDCSCVFFKVTGYRRER